MVRGELLIAQPYVVNPRPGTDLFTGPPPHEHNNPPKRQENSLTHDQNHGSDHQPNRPATTKHQVTAPKPHNAAALTSDMESSAPGIYVTGDCSSKLIGITYGAATGLAAARAIAAHS